MRTGVLAFFMAIGALAPQATCAATLVSSTPGAPDPGAAGDEVIDFEDGLPAGILFLPGSTFQILQGFAAHQGYPPAGDSTHYLSVPGGGAAGRAALDFTGYDGPTLGDFSFYWGSIDAANRLTIETTLGMLDVFGSDLITRGYGSATSATGNRRVGFALADGETLLRLTFASPTSFELDDIVFRYAESASVPEPATWLQMTGGMAIVGGALRRRRHVRRTEAVA